MTTLYICYQGVGEPLTQTQVIAYLEGLARTGYRIILLTFEPRPLTEKQIRDEYDRLKAKGIVWKWLRYHKRPTVPATAWDVAAGLFTGLALCRKYQVRIVHARAHVPGLIALVLVFLTKCKFLFDIRGFMAEEYVDSGIWPANGTLFRLVKRVERVLVAAASSIVVLTHRAKDVLCEWYPTESQGKPIHVIPTCVDRRGFPSEMQTNGDPTKFRTIVYVGKTGGSYATHEMTRFVAKACELMPNLRWEIWTQNEPKELHKNLSLLGMESRVKIGRVPPEDVAERLQHVDAGLSFMTPGISQVSRCPTKIAEYLAAGLPVVSTTGIGDVDDLVRGGGSPVGVLVPEFTESAYETAVHRLADLWNEPDIKQRCQKAAEEFDLELVGWTRYRQVYAELLRDKLKEAPE